MKHNYQYFKFKAEILRAFGFALMTPLGISFVKLIEKGLSFDNNLTIQIISSILSALAGYIFIDRSLFIMEDNYES